MSLTIHLPDDLERRLRSLADREGRSIEQYVLNLIERDAAGSEGRRVSEDSGARPGQAPALTDAEFEILLDKLASGPPLPHPPADFSRADIYTEHD